MGGGCCGILVGDIFIIITNLCQKYHRDGEEDCFGRLFGEFLPFVW